MNFGENEKETEILKPLSLNERDPISIVTPVNLPPQKYRDDSGILNYLENLGYTPTNRTAESDTKAKRANSFNEAVLSGDRALFPISGNRYGHDFLHRIDYESFSKYRPIFSTFSAASSILLALYYRSNTVTFYGPHVSFMYTKGEFSDSHFSINSFWNMLSRDNRVHGILNETKAKYCFKWENNNLVLSNPFSRKEMNIDRDNSNVIPFISNTSNQSRDKVSGKLLPSFIKSMYEAIQLGVEVNFDDRIVLIEGDEMGYEECYSVLEKVSKTRNLQDASAIVLCSFVTHKKHPPNTILAKELYDEKNALDFTKRVRKLLKDNVPIIYGFPMGHLKHKLTVPIGIEATLDLENGDISLNESPFSN